MFQKNKQFLFLVILSAFVHHKKKEIVFFFLKHPTIHINYSNSCILTLPSGIPKYTFLAIFTNKPISITPGISLISLLILFHDFSCSNGKCQSNIKFPLSVITGPYNK